MSEEAWRYVVAAEIVALFALEWRIGFYRDLVRDIVAAVRWRRSL